MAGNEIGPPFFPTSWAAFISLAPALSRLHNSQSPELSELWSNLVAHGPVIVWTMNAEGIITLSTGRGLDALGLAPGEIVGQSMFELYADKTQGLAAVRAALAGEEQHLLLDLNEVYFDSWMSPLRDADGMICGVFGVAIEVTAQIKAERSERNSSERFLKAFHASPAGILLTELETGRILDVNAALCRLTGFERDSLIGRTTLEVGFWMNAAHRAESIQDVLAGRSQARFHYRMLLPNGRKLNVTIVVETVELEGKQCALAIIRDNRRERRIKKALVRTRRRYRTLAKFAPVGIFQTNASGEWSYVNEEVCRMLARPRSAIKGSGWLTCIVEDDLDAVRQAWTATIQRHSSLKIEFRIHCHQENYEDSVLWLELQLEPSGDGPGFVGALTNIDRRKRAELDLQNANQRLEENVRLRTDMLMRASKTLEEQVFERRRTFEDLEKSEERWRALVNEAPDVIMLIDAAGNVEYINHTALRPELGVQNVVGQNVLNFAFEEYHQQIREKLRQVFEEGRAVTDEVAGPGDAGETRWFQSHLAPIYYNGKVISSTVIVRDVTTERQAQKELAQTQHRLAHAGRVSTVGELMAGFAHELGQPLFAISSYIEGCLIRLEREQGAPADVLSVMRDAIEQSHRAIAVVRRLREYLKKQEIQRDVHDLNQIVLDASELATVGVVKCQAKCTLQLSPVPLLTNVDRIQLMQVIVNLILNAAEAMAATPEEHRVITIRTLTDEQEVVCEVSDCGPGIPATDLSQLFDAFFTTKETGLGLGLSISRSIIDAHGGTIRATNGTAPAGAIFTIRLPGHGKSSRHDSDNHA